ncbi:hypothetical protein BOTCAL_0169g00120 [Botryotinia calthae]|uniref:Uncharacterized protein n=1 Tax=Botryotinia calthae TaxID=38488 RepID=A0A4Y8D1R7_9HELO|nr:hypothetical protein BOTCAL_0169g00120 [Botryotinia calthae]
MKLSTFLPIFAGTLAVALPTQALTTRDNKLCVTQGPGTCTFGWQEYTNHNGGFTSEARIYDHRCIQKGGLISSDIDQFVTVTSANPPMTVSINGWAQPPQLVTQAIPKFNYNGKTWGGKDGCACGEGDGTNFWGCRCGFDCPLG